MLRGYWAIIICGRDRVGATLSDTWRLHGLSLTLDEDQGSHFARGLDKEIFIFAVSISI